MFIFYSQSENVWLKLRNEAYRFMGLCPSLAVNHKNRCVELSITAIYAEKYLFLITALLLLQNLVLSAIDERHSVFVVLLDL